jgi:cytochrome c-type biogenesis protein CcmH/NrfF
MRRRAVILALTALLFTAPAAYAASHLNFLTVEGQFICTSCHEPLPMVSSPQAIAEKDYLATLVDKGESLSQIKATMVSYYGEAVLAEPPAKGFDLLLYVLPPALLAAAIALLLVTLPKWRARGRALAASPAGVAAASAPLDTDDAARLDAELERFR